MTSEGQVTVRVIQDEAGWDAIQGDWNDLFAVSPTASTPLDFAWLRGWWRVYKDTLRAGELRIVTIWRATQLIGALPLYVRSGRGGPFGVRRLGFISTGEADFEETCPDYLNILHVAGEESLCIDSAWQAIGRMEWDYLALLDLPEDTPLLRSQDVPPNAQRFSRGQCPVADLKGGFDTYLGNLSGKTRQHARQYLRAADRQEAVFELATQENMAPFWGDLIRLHQERWTAEGNPGCFAAARFTEFHQSLVRKWVPSGRAVLARLSHAGQVYAVLYGFLTRSKFDFYQSGISRNDACPVDSPGTTINLLLMRALAERGVTEYDFLRGSSSYKERLATRANLLIGIQIWRPSLRSIIYRSTRFAVRIVRKGFRSLRSLLMARSGRFLRRQSPP